MQLKEKIEQWLEPKLIEMQCFLVDLKVLNQGDKIEIYIDHLQQRITIGECENVSRYIKFQMDNDPDCPEKFVLDVSSPGMENAFKVPRQYEKAIGSIIEIVLENGMKKEGILRQYTQQKIGIEVIIPPAKKHLKPTYKDEEIEFSEIKTVKKKITFN